LIPIRNSCKICVTIFTEALDMKNIYINGVVFTGDENFKSAFAVENDRFLFVGTDSEALLLKENGDTITDLNGTFVMPGFIDSHMHVINYGSAMEMCDLTCATGSVDELVKALTDFLNTNRIPKGEWVRGRGWNQDLFKGEKTIPTRYDLDRISTVHPISITRCCGHCLIVNSKALEMLNITRDTPQLFGGHFDTDENGEPNGIFRDAAMDIIQENFPVPKKDDFKRMILKSIRKLNAYGVTSAHTDDLCVFDGADYEDVIKAYKELEQEGKLTVRIYEQSQFTKPGPLKEFLNKGYNTGVGTDNFKIGPLKLLGDGSLGARTAYLSKEYSDAPGEKGLALFTQEEFDEMISTAHQAGMQVAVHAIGDGILDNILSAYEKAFASAPLRDHRSGIVHVQLTRNDQLEKMKRLNMHAYAQTIFIDYDSHIVCDRVGDELAGSSYAFHSMKEMGIHVSNGTDCPVENPNPMRGIQCAVTRRPLAEDLEAYRPEEKMSLIEALASYTQEGAYASFEENRKGRIEKGYLADFVILSENPFDVPENRISRIKVMKTYLSGECVYEYQQ